MKKAIFVTAFLMALGFSSLAGVDPGKNITREVKIMPFDKLIVSANITVMLYESPDISTVVIQGKESLIQRIALLQKGSSLVITSGSKLDMKEKVTVFVPVNKLKSLEVSDDAFIKSQTILHSPQLDVKTDGLCEIHIIVDGVVNVKDGQNYSYVRRLRPEQAMMRLVIPTF